MQVLMMAIGGGVLLYFTVRGVIATFFQPEANKTSIEAIKAEETENEI
jgi:hypothetical protein